ncbi:UNVERIFIED_ORG: glucose-6-phosphate dehydrogenase assembly protein OpcA, partial [Arthrobacter sp. UYEF10]
PAQRISLPRRSLKDCLAEELRRLDPDEVFGETVRSLGSSRVHQASSVTFTCSGEPERNRDRVSLIAV